MAPQLCHQRDVPLLVHSRLFSEAMCSRSSSSRGHMLRAAAPLLCGVPGPQVVFGGPCVGGSDTPVGLWVMILSRLMENPNELCGIPNRWPAPGRLANLFEGQ